MGGAVSAGGGGGSPILDIFNAQGGGGGNIGGALGNLPGALGDLGGWMDERNPWVSAARDRKDQSNAILESLGDKPEREQFVSNLDARGNLKYKVDTPKKIAGKTVTADTVTAGQLDTKALGADARAQDAMRDRALAKGDSPWLKMQTQRQGVEEMSARDQAAQQAMSGAGAARSQLAMRGGLRGGAASRIAMQSARGMNAARQGIGRQGQLDRLSLGIADDQTRQNLLGQTAQLDLARAGQAQDMGKFNIGSKLDADKSSAMMALDASKATANLGQDAMKFNTTNAFEADKYNTGLATQGIRDQNMFNSDAYKQDMGAYGAGKQAAATAAGGGKK